MNFAKLQTKKWKNLLVTYSQQFGFFASERECVCHLFGPSLGASEATIFSKRGSPRSGSQQGKSFNWP